MYDYPAACEATLKNLGDPLIKIIYSISQEICTRFCCALLCCGYAIVHNEFIHIHQGCFAGTGAIVRLPQCQWSKPDGYGKISQCITTTKHSKAKTVCIFLGIYCAYGSAPWFNIQMSSYQYRKSHCGDKTVVRSSYLHNGISYTGKIISFYWIDPLVAKVQLTCYLVLLSVDSKNRLQDSQWHPPDLTHILWDKLYVQTVWIFYEINCSLRSMPYFASHMVWSCIGIAV